MPGGETLRLSISASSGPRSAGRPVVLEPGASEARGDLPFGRRASTRTAARFQTGFGYDPIGYGARPDLRRP